MLGLPTGLGMPVGLVAVHAAALDRPDRLVVVQSQPSFSLRPVLLSAASPPTLASHLPVAAAA